MSFQRTTAFTQLRLLLYLLTVSTTAVVMLFLFSSITFVKKPDRRLPGSAHGSPGRVYIVVAIYSGQQGAGLNALTSLQCWAGHLDLGIPVSVVEPVIKKSRFTGSVEAKEDSAKLSDYFNISHANNVSRELGLAEIVTVDEYLMRRPRRVVYLRTGGKLSDKVLWPNGSTSVCMDKAPFRSFMGLDICIVRDESLLYKRLSTANLREIVGDYEEEGMTLLLTKWSGPWYVQESCKRYGHTSDKSHFIPSQRLIEDAQRYVALHTGSSSLAVMIRAEHVVLNMKSSKEQITECFQEVLDLTRRLQGEDRGTPMLSADIGKYGSNSWNWAVKNDMIKELAEKKTREVIQSLTGQQMTFEDWEESFVSAANGVTNPGYIAALQRVIAARARCLVLFGGGHFQSLAFTDYQQVHGRNQCVHWVCAEQQ